MDRRDSYRLALAAGQASISTPNGRSISMLDVSASGVGLLVPREAVLSLGAPQALIHLSSDISFTADLDVVRFEGGDSSGVRIGSRFRSLADSAHDALSAFLIRGFLDRSRLPYRLDQDNMPSLVWRKPRAIESLLRLQAIETRQRLRLFRDDGTPLAQLTLLAAGRASLTAKIRQLAEDALELGRTYRCVITGLGSMLEFQARIVDLDGALVRIELPTELRQTGFRDSRRASLPESIAAISYRHPTSDRTSTTSLIEVGARGFSFAVPQAGKLLAPGQRLAQVELHVPEGPIQCEVIIRRAAPSDEGHDVICGAQIIAFETLVQRHRWDSFVFRATHENIELDPPEAVTDAWALLKSSNYVDLWSTGQCLARAYGDAWRGMSKCNGHILVANDGHDEVVGTAASNRVYPHTWLVHHLGFSKEQRTVGRMREFFERSRELSCGTIHTLRHVAAADYFIIYAEKAKRWNRILYEEFVRSYSNKPASLLTTNKVHRYRFDDAEGVLHLVDPRRQVEVELASEQEELQIAAKLARVLCPLEIAALSYDPDQIGLRGFSLDCAASGYERHRSLYLARESGAMVAVLVAETGSEGTNVFGLLNSCRILSLDERPIRVETKAALLEAAKAHYLCARKSQFILMDDPDGDDSIPARAGFEPISPGMRWIVKREVMSSWADYVDNIFRTSMVLSAG